MFIVIILERVTTATGDEWLQMMGGETESRNFHTIERAMDFVSDLLTDSDVSECRTVIMDTAKMDIWTYDVKEVPRKFAFNPI